MRTSTYIILLADGVCRLNPPPRVVSTVIISYKILGIEEDNKACIWPHNRPQQANLIGRLVPIKVLIHEIGKILTK